MATQRKKPTVESHESERLNRLEAAQAETNAEVRALTHNVNQLTDVVKDLAQNFNVASKPQWQSMAAWAGVLLMVIGYFVVDGRERVDDQDEAWDRRHNRLEEWNRRQEAKREALEKRSAGDQVYLKWLSDRISTVEDEQKRRTDRVYREK